MFEHLTEYPMDRFIHRQNLEHFRKRLAETTDEAQRGLLLKQLTEQEAKDQSPPEKDQPPPDKSS